MINFTFDHDWLITFTLRPQRILGRMLSQRGRSSRPVTAWTWIFWTPTRKMAVGESLTARNLCSPPTDWSRSARPFSLLFSLLSIVSTCHPETARGERLGGWISSGIPFLSSVILHFGRGKFITYDA